MQMTSGRIAALLAIAGVSLWLLLAGPSRLLGFDTGNIGIVLLMGGMWVSLYTVSRASRDDLEVAGSPGEWKAWLGLAFNLLAVIYFLAKAPVFMHMTAWNDPNAQAVARNLVMLMIAWAVLSQLLDSRWKRAVRKDERDREVARVAAGWGRGALIFGIVGIAVALGLSPAEKLPWAKPFVIANLLIFALMCGWLAECATAVIMYWRNRR